MELAALLAVNVVNGKVEVKGSIQRSIQRVIRSIHAASDLL